MTVSAVISERDLKRLAEGKAHCVHAYRKILDEDDVALVRLSDAQLLAAEVERLRADAERYQAIRNAGSLLKIYRYDDPADCCSGDWRYKPGAEEVDAWADEILSASRALATQEAK